ncbi:hypothetical protein BE17_01640 [Sorangium cellulosum]|uniref:Uncharacterized protein n=1 Tax=Sorangium cellulosum TaxID=56 RepID=A0A150RZH9_SORCE|nr:hypothetical protein BE17_01640 [Sorangium cellulosum]
MREARRAPHALLDGLRSGFAASFDEQTEATLVGGAHGPISMDVTGLVQAWIDGAHENHGLLLEQNPTGRTMYRPREHLRTDDRPWL